MSLTQLLIIAGVPALPLLVVCVAVLASICRRESGDRMRLNVLRALLWSVVVMAVVYSGVQTVLLAKSQFQGFSLVCLPLFMFVTSAVVTRWHIQTIRRRAIPGHRHIRSSR